MSHIRRLLLVVCFLFAAAPSQAQFVGAADSISFQGVLANGAGIPVADGSYSMVFSMYDVAIGGTAVWSETQSVTTSEGVYNVMLGRVASLNQLAFDKQLWLGVKIGADAEMAPRIALASAPYALSLRNLRVQPENSFGGEVTAGPNLIGGFSGNSVAANMVGATIGGGGGEYSIDLSADRSGKTAAPGFLIEQPNEVTASYGTIAGGWGNSAAQEAFVGGGESNKATGSLSVVVGGQDNLADAFSSTIGGGRSNSATSNGATVPGGTSNEAGGQNSLAAGYSAVVRDAAATGDENGDEGTFVWSDMSQFTSSSLDDFISTGPNQFLIRAAGGVGVGTNSPGADIHLKQSTAAATRGIRIEYASDSDYWQVYIDAANDFNFRYNGVLTAFINDATGEYIDFIPSPDAIGVLSKARAQYRPVLTDVRALRPLEARYESDDRSTSRPVLDVNEVERLFPEIVVEKDGQKAVAYQRLGVVAIKAIQELEARVAELERLVQASLRE